MRKKHFKIANDHLRDGDVGWFFRQAWKYLAIPLSRGLGRPLTGPILAGIVITYRCNYRCIMCDLPLRAVERKRAGLSGEFTPDEMRWLIDDIARLRPSGLVFTGGEPFLRKDLLELADYAHSHGLYCSVSSNGSLIDAALADRIVTSGLSAIGISIDGSTPELMEFSRGVRGSLDQASQAVVRIAEARQRRCSNISLTVAACINRENINDVLNILQFVREVGADALSFNVAMNIGLLKHAHQRAEQFSLQRNQFDDAEKVMDELLRVKREEGIIDGSAGFINLARHALRGEELPIPCFASNCSVFVDCYGDVFPCIGWVDLNKSIGNVRQERLSRFWYSDKYQTIRGELDACRACYFACQMEWNLLYQPWAKLAGMIATVAPGQEQPGVRPRTG